MRHPDCDASLGRAILDFRKQANISTRPSKTDLAYPTVLATYGIPQFLDHRRVGNQRPSDQTHPRGLRPETAANVGFGQRALGAEPAGQKASKIDGVGLRIAAEAVEERSTLGNGLPHAASGAEDHTVASTFFVKPAEEMGQVRKTPVALLNIEDRNGQKGPQVAPDAVEELFQLIR